MSFANRASKLFSSWRPEVRQQPHLFDEVEDDEHDAECGLWCGSEAA